MEVCACVTARLQHKYQDAKSKRQKTYSMQAWLRTSQVDDAVKVLELTVMLKLPKQC